MSRFERIDDSPGFEQSATAFIEEYDVCLEDLREAHLRGADTIVATHTQRLVAIFEQDEDWTEQDLTTALNVTSSSLGKLLHRTYAEVDGLLQETHEVALNSIPAADAELWTLVQEQIGEFGLDSDEVSESLKGASSQQSATMMRIACDYPLWVFAQYQVEETGGGPPLMRITDAASGPEASAALLSGLDHVFWKQVHGYAISYSAVSAYRMAEARSLAASDERVQAGFEAGLDYQVAMSLKRVERMYEKGRKPFQEGSIRTNLWYATSATQPLLTALFGDKYDEVEHAYDREEAEGEDYYRDLADEIMKEFPDISPEELLAKIIGRMDGTEEDDFGFADEWGSWGRPGTEIDPNVPNPYEVLGVDKDADQRQIKAAYRRLALEHHPDTGGEDGEAIRRINDAYNTINDPGRRAYYDAYGTSRGYRS